jgi:DNA-binding NtrC family response regulator
MSDPLTPETGPPLSSEFVRAMSGVFESLGRALVCVDADFRVVHASPGLDAIAGPGAAERLTGRPLEESLGAELFGAEGTLRRALAAGERREGWGASLRHDDAARLLSLSAAPVTGVDSPLCDPRVAYLIVVRSGEDAGAAGAVPALFSGMVASSKAMLDVFRLVQHLAESDATVLITGESGTGKELVARALHDNSPRRTGPFVAVNCGAIPSELLESELFGHVRGAFTGAVRDRAGRFELANGGALFLDEVGDLPLPLQVKLLRVLQERTFERVGDGHTRRTDARILAATNRDLKREVAEGRFREDLLYRLRVVPIVLAPLRERREDIEPLAHHLLARVTARQGRSQRLAPDALRALLDYSWPGNARELENALERALLLASGDEIQVADLPAGSEGKGREVEAERPERGLLAAALEKQMSLRELSDLYTDRILDLVHGNKVRAARILGINRRTLYRRGESRHREAARTATRETS